VLSSINAGNGNQSVQNTPGVELMLTRRHFISTTAAIFSAPLASPVLAKSWPTAAQKAAWDMQVTPVGFDPATSNPWGLEPRFLPQRVVRNDGLIPGDIHVDAVARYLYHIEDGGTAMRYGVAIGRGGLYEPGIYTIKRKVEWPHWTPTQNMIEREPETYAQFEGGVEPGPQNALGSRALYLYVGDRDTYLRIHGTPQPRSIGSRASSGCVRMVMPHINDLYSLVETGSTAHLYSAEDSVATPSVGALW
jgi:lipoprotein-anchoring transpeptidase ErfK/SrfK